MRMLGVLLAGVLATGSSWAKPGPGRRPRLTGDASGVRVEHGRRGSRRRSRRHSRRHGRRLKRRRRAPAPAGHYAGVRPGARSIPRGPKPPSAGACWLTWPGFQLTHSGSRIFLQFTARHEPTIQAKGRVMELLFPDCRIHLHNNARTLVTRYFPTPVLSVRARRRHKAILVTVRLRRPVRPKVAWQRADGLVFYNLDFPK